MPEVKERYMTVRDLRTHVLSAGEGPPLVYLHGAAPAGIWLPIHDLLARHFTVYAPDHPGFGLTARPAWLEGMDDVVLHYDELFRDLELDRPALVGFSLGGWIAAELAVFYPERLRALVLVNSGGLHLDEAPIADLLGMDGKTLSQLVFHDPDVAATYSKRGDLEARIRQFHDMTTLALLAWNPWFDPKLASRLRRIFAPALALWAEHDRLLPLAYGEAFRDGIPGARLEVLPDCGHMAPLERPEQVAEAVTRFVREAGE